MRITQLGEDRLIRRWTRALRNDRSVLRGVGDDCAVLSGAKGVPLLFASDMLVEGVHFRASADPAAVGWKALAVNVSDIAAMGGLPRYAVVSLGFPPSARVARTDGLYRGLKRCADRFGVNLVGGDTGRASCWVIGVAILGEVEPRRLVCRTGARPGDWLLVTGRLGGAVESGRHLTFTPRLREARVIGARIRPRAMMDLSDGLWTDLPRLCRASGVGAVVETGRIPRQAGCSLRQAVAEGEDFELLMAIPPEQAKPLLRWAAWHLRCGLTTIGRIVRGRLIRYVDAAGKELRFKEGFKHF
jgi:thiamine-monophosphate kinase